MLCLRSYPSSSQQQQQQKQKLRRLMHQQRQQQLLQVTLMQVQQVTLMVMLLVVMLRRQKWSSQPHAPPGAGREQHACLIALVRPGGEWGLIGCSHHCGLLWVNWVILKGLTVLRFSASVMSAVLLFS
jgi:hypothetical protein